MQILYHIYLPITFFMKVKEGKRSAARNLKRDVGAVFSHMSDQHPDSVSTHMVTTRARAEGHRWIGKTRFQMW